jgi:hypothetical protein
MNNMPFNVRDCTLIMRMGGVEPAANMRELRERVAVCPTESLFHHFCETVIRPTFDDPEFRNDFAVWSAHSLNDRVLAERLGIINPYVLSSFEELREIVIDILDERLSEVPFVQWALGGDFRFMQAATVVFDSDIDLVEPGDLVEQLPNMSHSSIYYHFVEARRRTPDGSDDFTVWLQDFGESTEPMRAALASIDFYHLTLSQLKDKATSALRRVEIPEVKHDG